jgi:hypothetical protein
MRVEALHQRTHACAASLTRGDDAGILLAEFVDPARSIENLLLAGIERVAARTDFDLEIMTNGRARLEAVATAADDVDFGVVGMNCCFHENHPTGTEVSSTVIAVAGGEYKAAGSQKGRAV